MRRLMVCLLGKFRVTCDGTPLELHRVQARLLALLVGAGGREVRRDRLASFLWPELPDARARANLSNVIWRLRRTLTLQCGLHDVVHASDTAVWVCVNSVDSDIARFSAGTAEPDCELSLSDLERAVEALKYYKGDLLEDWDIEWCQVERESLRRRYLETLRAVAAAFERRGRDDLAFRYTREAMEADPYDERLSRQIVRLHLARGDRAAAVREFRRFARLIQAELGLPPDEQTRVLLEEGTRLGGSSRAGIQAVIPEKVRFVGRYEERRLLTSFVENALKATAGGALIVGEAGIGKSRLAEWATEVWVAGGGVVAHGRCVEFNDPVPFQPLLSALGRHLVADDSLRAVGEPELRFDGAASASVSTAALLPSDHMLASGRLKIFEWLRTRMSEAAARRPLLVVLEDIQWADPSTVDFLRYVLEWSGSTGVAFLLTGRPTPADASVNDQGALVGRHCVLQLPLGPLSESETCELAVQLLNGPIPWRGFCEWVYRETEGNPLFVVEIVRSLAQRPRGGTVAENQGGAVPTLGTEDHVDIPRGIRAAIMQRVVQLGADAQRLTSVASVLGRAFDHEMLALVSRMSERRLINATSTLLRMSVLEQDGAGYAFTHDKIRAVCYELLQPTQKRLYHARAAAVLAHDPDVSVRTLAWHQQAAGQWAAAAASWSQAGEHALEVHALDETARAYQSAIACLRRDRTQSSEVRGIEQIRVLSRLDDVFALQGRPAERRRVIAQMTELLRRAGLTKCRSTVLLRRAMLDEYLGSFASASKLARSAWWLARVSDDGSTEVWALRVLALAMSRGGRERRSLCISRLALRRLGSGASLQRGLVLLDVAVVHQKLGQYAEALDCARQATSLLAAVGRSGSSAFASLVVAAVQKQQGDLESARDRSEGALATFRRIGDRVSEARATYQLATLDALECKAKESLTRIRSARSTLKSAGYSRMYAACLNEIAYGVGRLLGNYAWAWRASERALELSRAYQSAHATAIYLDTRAQLLLELDRVEEAQQVVDEAIALLGGELTSTGQFAESRARRGAVRLRAGDLVAAVEDLEAARRAQTQRGEQLHLPDTLTHLAVAYALLGDAGRAVAASEEALRVLGAVRGANHQPQRLYWNHYRILARFDRQPRLPFLRRAARLVEAQAAALTPAQARRFRRAVRVNREILEAWAELQGQAVPGADHAGRATEGHARVTPTVPNPAEAAVAPGSE